MSNCYTNTCFAIVVTAAEAALIRQSVDFCNAISDEDDETITSLWSQQTPELQAIYPATTDLPASGFLAIFDDPHFPYIDAEFTYVENEDGRVTVTGQSGEFSPENVANILARCVTTSLPIGVTWANDSDKFIPGHFGGGGFHINAEGIHWISTHDVERPEAFQPRYVLAVKDENEGLLFWSEGEGFGNLAGATVLTEVQRAGLALPTTLNEPQWLPLPRA